MKLQKSFTIFLLALVILASFPNLADAKTTVNWKSLYESFLAKHVFTLDREFYSDEEYMTLVDIDRDGVPELIYGETYRTVNSTNVILTIRDGQVVKLKDQYPGDYYEGNYNIGMSAFLTNNYSYSGIKLYYNSLNGNYKYVGEDTGNSVDGDYVPTIEINISGSTLITKLISNAHFLNSDKLGLEGFAEYFEVNGKEVSKAQYQSYMKSYYKNLVEVPHGGVTMQPKTIFDMEEGRINYSALHQFFNSYTLAEAINMNQTPAKWAQSEAAEANKLQLVPDEINRAYTNSINRLEFSQLIIQFLAVKLNATPNELLAKYKKTINNQSFTDTKDKNVLVAQALGIVSGKGNNTFDPDGFITRQEAAVMLTRTAKLLNLNAASVNEKFKDSGNIANWAKVAVDFVVSIKDSTNKASIMGGTGDSKFSPAAFYSRQQAIITVKRLYNAR